MNLKNTRISINGKTAKQLQNSFISSFRQWLNDPYIGEILFLQDIFFVWEGLCGLLLCFHTQTP